VNAEPKGDVSEALGPSNPSEKLNKLSCVECECACECEGDADVDVDDVDVEDVDVDDVAGAVSLEPVDGCRRIVGLERLSTCDGFGCWLWRVVPKVSKYGSEVCMLSIMACSI
jgi:hypothetical protein